MIYIFLSRCRSEHQRRSKKDQSYIQNDTINIVIEKLTTTNVEIMEFQKKTYRQLSTYETPVKFVGTNVA